LTVPAAPARQRPNRYWPFSLCLRKSKQPPQKGRQNRGKVKKGHTAAQKKRETRRGRMTPEKVLKSNN